MSITGLRQEGLLRTWGKVTESFIEFLRRNSHREDPCDCGKSNSVCPGRAHTEDCALNKSHNRLFREYLSVKENKEFTEGLLPRNTIDD